MEVHKGTAKLNERVNKQRCDLIGHKEAKLYRFILIQSYWELQCTHCFICHQVSLKEGLLGEENADLAHCPSIHKGPLIRLLMTSWRTFTSTILCRSNVCGAAQTNTSSTSSFLHTVCWEREELRWSGWLTAQEEPFLWGAFTHDAVF